MCGDGLCGQGAAYEDCCKVVYDDVPSQEQLITSAPKLPRNKNSSSKGNTQGIECFCFYAPIPGYKAPQYQNPQISAKQPTSDDVFVECRPYRDQRDPPGYVRDFCDVPAHENLAIPYPRPAPSVELRGGQIYSGCQCVKRDGLQHDCPRTGCQGRPPCMAYPAPQCVPSGNAPPPEPSEVTRERGRWPGGGRRPEAAGAEPRGQGVDDDRYVRLGRRGYRENPPVKRRTHVPCEEHRKPRC